MIRVSPSPCGACVHTHTLSGRHTQLVASKHVFMPDLEVQLRPALEALGCQVNVCKGR